ncbi:MAG: DUF4339 domain-containing protein [Planctomycetales bacterium]
MATRWYCTIVGETLGPFSFGELRELVQAGTLGEEDQVRLEHQTQWQRAESVIGLFHGLRATESQAPENSVAVPALGAPRTAPESSKADRAALSETDTGGKRLIDRLILGTLGALLLCLAGLGWSAWGDYQQAQRFPPPRAVRERQQTSERESQQPFWGFSLVETLVLGIDGVVIVGAVLFMVRRGRERCDP